MSPAHKRVVALVVVHGMGSQRRSETLLQWAEPLLRRLDWVSRGSGGDGVAFERVALAGDAPDEVNARVRFRGDDGAQHEVVLVVTEARWAESFLPLQPGEVFAWGGPFAWRALLRLGSHFTRIIWVNPWWRVVSAPVVAAFWLVLAGTGLLLTLLFPLVGLLLLVPGVSWLVRGVTSGLAEFVGDVAVWTRRPVRAAAMRAVVRDGVRSASVRAALLARAEGEEVDATQVVLLAHSQGATIAAQTLFDPATGEVRVPVDAFVTVGGTLALLGAPRWTTGRLAGVRAAVAGVPRAERGPGGAASRFSPVEEWSRLERRPRWLNLWAIWDPFTAGTVSTSMRARELRWREVYGGPASDATGPEEHPVHNTANPFTEHQAYARNTAQVIDPLVRLLTGIALADPGAPARGAAHARSVRQLGVGRILALVLALALLVSPAVPAALSSVVDLLALGTAPHPALGPIVAVVVGVVALWGNGVLWRGWAARVEWTPPGTPAPKVWTGGFVVRAVLLVGVWLAVGGPAVVHPVWAALAAVAVLVLPEFWRLPRVLPERR
ncbi:hypothetical protein GCM10027413_15420 [Conyzicola nivalis]|uniref:Alpha/beta hydrolase n=1 Tax=Conyzicola nivalis TaxID=1477021 RepID=A0A916WHT4_9MICO|nr:hypothetical protein [Conyzicola nivalis]GGA98465.1 hypothetical protein GCM10010979_11200 [Conyzicola nivalis]